VTKTGPLLARRAGHRGPFRIASRPGT